MKIVNGGVYKWGYTTIVCIYLDSDWKGEDKKELESFWGILSLGRHCVDGMSA